MSEHCKHCDPERPGLCYESKEFGIVHVSTESGEWHAHWVDGHCPMCAEAGPDSERAFARGWDAGAEAERERIAKTIKAEACTVEEAVDIARGAK